MASIPLRISKQPDAVDQITPPDSYDEARTLGAQVPNSHHTPPSDTSNKADSDTRFTQLPRIIEAFQRYARGGGLPRKIAYPLARGEYVELQRQLGDQAHPQIRFDYYAPTRRFYFRMPGPKHERFLRGLDYEIQLQLAEIANGSDDVAATFARNIDALGSTTKKYPSPEEESKHDPDAQFGHKDSQYASVIIEVADSQSGKKLRDCANSYLLGSNGLVNVVIGFDFAYGPRTGLKTTMLIWTLDVDPQRKIRKVVNQVQPLRDDQGNAVGPGLRLKLSQFAPKSLVLQDHHDYDITISAQRLCEILSRAEYCASIPGLPPPDWYGNDPEWTDLPQPKTPPEEISEEDESEGTEWEEEDRKRDPDWEE